MDFALMYIPAENVYYEVVLKEQGREDILDYAWARRVFPASPNSFYTYLQVIYFGLRGLEVEQNARRIIESLTRLKDDFDRFAEDYRLVGSHLRRAQSKHDEGLPKLESIRRALPGHLATAASVEALEAGDTAEPSMQENFGWEYDPSVTTPRENESDDFDPFS